MNLKPIIIRIKFNEMKPPHPSRHKSRINRIANAIENQFPSVNRPERIKLKHMHWIVNQWLSSQNYQPTTRTDYINSLKLMIEALGRKRHWLGPLNINAKGPGGRPRVSRVVKSKKYYRK